MANSRPLGARLDSGKAKLAKARGKEEAAETQLQKAMQQLDEARKQKQLAEDTLAELRAKVPNDNDGARCDLMRCTRTLLERLESGRFAANAEMPEEIISAMTAVHEVVNSMEPPPTATLDSPLQTQGDGSHKEDTQDAEDDATMDETEVMGRLDGVDDSDSEALLEIARRLKRARRS